jgi:FKBP-type peptidyl-prolyl cis-trans isomerase
MAQAQNGDTVKIHYAGKLEDGSVFSSSSNQGPLQLVGKDLTFDIELIEIV